MDRIHKQKTALPESYQTWHELLIAQRLIFYRRSEKLDSWLKVAVDVELSTGRIVSEETIRRLAKRISEPPKSNLQKTTSAGVLCAIAEFLTEKGMLNEKELSPVRATRASAVAFSNSLKTRSTSPPTFESLGIHDSFCASFDEDEENVESVLAFTEISGNVSHVNCKFIHKDPVHLDQRRKNFLGWAVLTPEHLLFIHLKEEISGENKFLISISNLEYSDEIALFEASYSELRIDQFDLLKLPSATSKIITPRIYIFHKTQDGEFDKNRKLLHNKEDINCGPILPVVTGKTKLLDTTRNLIEPEKERMGDLNSYFYSIYQNDASAVEAYLAEGIDVDEGDPETGTTLLHHACSTGDEALVILAVYGAGAKLDCIDASGNTPTDLAVLSGNTRILKILEDFRASITDDSHPKPEQF